MLYITNKTALPRYFLRGIFLRIVNYSLYSSENYLSVGYYNVIAEFADKITKTAESDLSSLCCDFMDFCKDKGFLPLRISLELYVEILGLGVMWKVYGAHCCHKTFILRKSLIKIAEMRKSHNSLKPILDRIKGFLLAFTYNPEKTGSFKEPTPARLKLLVSLLNSFGDFEYEAVRFGQWVTFLSSLPGDKFKSYINKIAAFESWFEKAAEKILSVYTQKVSDFITKKESFYRFREDYVFCLRKPVEYHYNMAGAELLSRAYREEFIGTKKKMILLPACMKANNGRYCRAKDSKFGQVCLKCTQNCIINRISSEFIGSDVYIISHESNAFSGSGHIGIVGVSCVTRLIEGGFQARKLGFAPQCVLLDYCGCNKHWDENGISTLLNIEKLKDIFIFKR